ncbi:MAG: glycosyltransferase [bacterium]|nr:glycosyltransferase [bacterium]
MQEVQLENKTIEDYREIVGNEVIDDLIKNAAPLKNKKIIEINSTSAGGGVAEILKAKIPLLRNLGVDASWLVIPPDDDFFKVTKNIHNCLQGNCGQALKKTDTDYYIRYLNQISEKLPTDADLYVLHDPQTLGLINHLKGKKVIWRCHIDLTEADQKALEWIQSFYPRFNKIVFSLDEYVKGFEHKKTTIIHPAIDPLSTKNKFLRTYEAKKIITDLDVNTDKPYMLQVSRFDKFKDPIGVLKIFSMVRKFIPNLQCVLMGNYATDDPDGKIYYDLVMEKAQELKRHNIHIINKSDDLAVNALQTLADVVIQNSNKEGFGLTVTEALWKGRFVFSHPVGGIALQVLHDQTGFYLGYSDDANADKIVDVLKNKEYYSHIEQNAKEHVRKNFLITTMLGKFVNLYGEVLKL